METAILAIRKANKKLADEARVRIEISGMYFMMVWGTRI